MLLMLASLIIIAAFGTLNALLVNLGVGVTTWEYWAAMACGAAIHWAS